MELMLETEYGLLNYAKKEAETILGLETIINPEFNLIMLNTNNFSETVTKLFMFSETFYNIYLKLLEFEFSTMDDFYNEGKLIKWYEFWDPNLTFAVKAHVKDQEEMKEIGKNLGQAVVDSFKEKYGKKIKVDLSKPDIEIHVWKKDQKALVGINLNGKQLSSFEDLVSRSLIMASGWDGKSSLAEILYSGVSLSAYRFATDYPLRERILNTPFIKLKIIDKQLILSLLRRSWMKSPPKIVLYEPLNRINVLKQEVPDISKITIRDITELSLLEEKYIISNLWQSISKKEEQINWFSVIIEKLVRNGNWDNLLFMTSFKPNLEDIKSFAEVRDIQELFLKGNIVYLIAIRKR